MSSERLRVDAPVADARLVPRTGDGPALDGFLEELRREAHAAGMHEGAQRTAAALELALERLEAARAELLPALAHTAVQLAVEIARVLLRTEIKRGHYDIEKLVRETLSEAAVGRSACVVHLNPADHARLEGVRFRSGTRIEPDVGVPQGDVHVETPIGLLVRDVESALESIERRLHEELE